MGAIICFAQDGVELGDLTSLKPFGINADIKHGQRGAGISVAPPSRHVHDHGFSYSWDGCDETMLADLPPLNGRVLAELIAGGKSKVANHPRDNSRGLNLNARLVAFVSQGFDEDQDVFTLLLSEAAEINDGFERQGRGKLKDSEVLKRTQAVLNDYQDGKFTHRVGRRATATTSADEIKLVLSTPSGEDAFAFLQLLRADHGPMQPRRNLSSGRRPHGQR